MFAVKIAVVIKFAFCRLDIFYNLTTNFLSILWFVFHEITVQLSGYFKCDIKMNIFS